MSTLAITFDDQAVDVSFTKKSVHFTSLQITKDKVLFEAQNKVKEAII
ncbi:hypothetical protein [Legionella qingyii]|nr:hypothetical protein [Legionella qingyii]